MSSSSQLVVFLLSATEFKNQNFPIGILQLRLQKFGIFDFDPSPIVLIEFNVIK